MVAPLSVSWLERFVALMAPTGWNKYRRWDFHIIQTESSVLGAPDLQLREVLRRLVADEVRARGERLADLDKHRAQVGQCITKDLARRTRGRWTECQGGGARVACDGHSVPVRGNRLVDRITGRYALKRQM